MNLEESELFSSEMAKTNRQKKAVLVVIFILVLLLIFLIAMTIVVKQKENNRFKVYYNGAEYKSYPSNFITTDEDGDYYVSIKQMAELEGYTYNPGEYKKYEETKDSCNVAKYLEVTSLSADKDYFYKTIDKTVSNSFFLAPYGVKQVTEKEMIELTTTAANGSVETFETDKPVLLINDELYAPLTTIRDVFNVRVVVGQNNVQFESLNYVYAKVSKNIVEAGYTTMSGDFEDVRALIYDLAIISDGTYQGVVETQGYKQVISKQYSALQFIQNSKEFLATAVGTQGILTVGLISADGNTIIKPTEYDAISVLSDKNGLYLVTKGTDYGVLNREGEIVVHVEYDKIGLTNMSDFPLEDSTNASVLFEKFIPVVSEGKYGLFNIDGEETLRPVYDSLGYIKVANAENVSAREMNVLSIPAELGIKGIVVKWNGYYGVYDMTTERLCIPCVFEKLYAETRSGVTTYYIQEPGGIPIDLALFIEQNDLANVDKDGNPIQAKVDEQTMTVTTDGNTTTEVNSSNTSTEETVEPVVEVEESSSEEEVVVEE